MQLSNLLKSNGKKLFIVGFLAFIALYYFWFFVLSGDALITTHSKNEDARQVLVAIRNDIKIGDNYEQVLQNYWAKDSSKLRLRLTLHTSTKDQWLITMPSEWDAKDWRIYIKFENGKVIGYKIRTFDGERPKEAPEDIGTNDE